MIAKCVEKEVAKMDRFKTLDIKLFLRCAYFAICGNNKNDILGLSHGNRARNITARAVTMNHDLLFGLQS